MEDLKNHLKKKIVSQLDLIFNGTDFRNNLNIASKSDNSIVTKVDTIISDLVKKEIELREQFNGFTFFCEEDHDELYFPCVVLDPIDGTRELSQGIPECAVSMAVMYSSKIDDPKNWGWIFNPFTGFEIDSDQPFCQPLNLNKNLLFGMVSRSEWSRGLHSCQNKNIIIQPKGSIALKLGLLSAGAIDFVVSKRAKNIWDIAAGSIICSRKNIKTWQNEKLVEKLETKMIEASLTWATDNVFQLLQKETL